MGDDTANVHEDFVAESQELIESLSRDLLLLDHMQKEGGSDPDAVNSVFRAVHTLKGMAGMFGFQDLSDVSHHLEDLLEHLRLGRVDITQPVLDVLFEGVEVLQHLVGRVSDPDAPLDIDVAGYVQRVAAKLDGPGEDRNGLGDFDLDPNILSVLTEYEEHRLRTNVKDGVGIYRLQVRFALTSIDTDLDELKERAKSVAEIITYLPSLESDQDDAIELEVILASRASMTTLRDLFGGPNSEITPVSRRRTNSLASGPRHSLPAKASRAAVSIPPRAPSGAPPREVSADALALRAVSQTVRVDIGKLDRLMNVVGELGIVRNSVARITDQLKIQSASRQVANELHRLHRAFERHLESLQDGLIDVRMVPLRQTFDRLARAIRQLARERDKEVRLVVSGAETEVDKLIVEELTDPLLHLIRNAIDHGVEAGAERKKRGKPPGGTLAINAYHKGNHVVIEVEDDGAGMDPEKILQSAIERGVVNEETADELTTEEIRRLIFVPGMSTAETVTDISGRGVGMDVVKTNITSLGGVIDVRSQLGVGTRFTITLPITLAIVSALILRVSGRTFALPLTVVQEALLLSSTDLRRVDRREVLSLRGTTLPVCRLEQLFNLGPSDIPLERRFVVVTSLGQRRLGLVVDALEGQQDIIVKGLGASLNDVRGFSGATDLGDQRVVLVLDAATLLDEILSGTDASVRGEIRP